MKVITASPQLGVVISDINLAEPISPLIKQQLVQLLFTHHLLIFPNQQLQPQHLITTASLFTQFGTIGQSLAKFKLPGFPQISLMSNVKDEQEQPTGTIVKPKLWHSDSFMTDNPDIITLLYCIEAPKSLGETLFVNTQAAYENLSTAEQQLLDDKKIIFKNLMTNSSPVHVPIIRTNRLTGKKSLYLNIKNFMGIEGIPDNQSKELVEKLYYQIISEQNIFAHKWHNNDVIMWHNPSTMHAPNEYDNSNCVLQRLIIKEPHPII